MNLSVDDGDMRKLLYTTNYNAAERHVLCMCFKPRKSTEPVFNKKRLWLIPHYECACCGKLHRPEILPKLDDMVGPRCECKEPQNWNCGFQCVVCEKILRSQEHVFPAAREYDIRCEEQEDEIWENFLRDPQFARRRFAHAYEFEEMSEEQEEEIWERWLDD